MPDLHAAGEVAPWCNITSDWLACIEKLLGDDLLPEDDEKNLRVSIAIATGVEDAVALGVPADAGRRLLSCYDGLSEK